MKKGNPGHPLQRLLNDTKATGTANKA